MANSFLDTWQQLTVTTSAGELGYTVFPGPPPFVGCTFLDGRPVAPVEAQRLLVALGHEHGGVACIGGDDWADRLAPRQGM